MAVFAPLPQQYFDNNGDPLSGGTIETYEAGTTTPKITYTSEDESTPNANPVVLDASGRADVWLESGSYRLVIRDDMGALIVELDDITGAAANVFGNAVVDVSTNLNVTSVYRNSVLRVDTSPITLTLLPASTAGEGFLFSVKNVSGGDITIDPDAAELIDGASTLFLQDGQSALIVCDGSAWVSLFIAPDILEQDNLFTGDNTFTGKTAFKNAGELTIASNTITITGTSHSIDTEADAASDELHTIDGGSDGELLILRTEDASRVVVIKDGLGNIETVEGSDITLDATDKTAVLQYDAALASWVVVNSILVAATNEKAGIVEKATQSEMVAETAEKYPDASVLKNSPTATKAWVNFDGSGTVSINDSYNVSSITDRGTGRYTVNLSITMANADYAAVFGAGSSFDDGIHMLDDALSKTITTVPVSYRRIGSIPDGDNLAVAIFGELA